MSDIRNTPIHTKSGLGSAEIGEQISYVDDVDNFIISYPADYPKEKPIFMNDMSMNRSTEPCSAALTGVSQTSLLDETEGGWGRVDFFEMYDSGHGYLDYEGERPFCAQPSSAVSRYAFCSQKDGKTVVICISQMTDNPELAEEIFSTFKWLE